MLTEELGLTRDFRVRMLTESRYRNYTLTNLRNCFHSFGEGKFFTVLIYTMVIIRSYCQKQLTSFFTSRILYQFTRVHFGLNTGAHVLTRLLDKIFSDIKFKYIFYYHDNLVVYSNSWEEQYNSWRCFPD